MSVATTGLATEPTSCLPFCHSERFQPRRHSQIGVWGHSQPSSGKRMGQWAPGAAPALCLWHPGEVSCISLWKSLISALWWSHNQFPYKLQHQKTLTKQNIPSPVHWNRFIFMRNVLMLGSKSFHFASNQHCTPTCRCWFFFFSSKEGETSTRVPLQACRNRGTGSNNK